MPDIEPEKLGANLSWDTNLPESVFPPNDNDNTTEIWTRDGIVVYPT